MISLFVHGQPTSTGHPLRTYWRRRFPAGCICVLPLGRIKIPHSLSFVKICRFHNFAYGARCTTGGATHLELSVRITLEGLGGGLSIPAAEASESQMGLVCPTSPMHWPFVLMMLKQGGGGGFGYMLTPIGSAITCHCFCFLVPCSAKNLSTSGCKACYNYIA